MRKKVVSFLTKNSGDIVNLTDGADGKSRQFFSGKNIPSFAAPGDTNPSDATGGGRYLYRLPLKDLECCLVPVVDRWLSRAVAGPEAAVEAERAGPSGL